MAPLLRDFCQNFVELFRRVVNGYKYLWSLQCYD